MVPILLAPLHYIAHAPTHKSIGGMSLTRVTLAGALVAGLSAYVMQQTTATVFLALTAFTLLWWTDWTL